MRTGRRSPCSAAPPTFLIRARRGRSTAASWPRAGRSSPSGRPGTEVYPRFFPARNRIMAALAGWVVIVEGAHRSGTQHTVRQAAKLGREVLAVPGPVNSSLSELPNELLSEGAPVVRDAQDLLDHVLGPGQTQVRGVGPELEPELSKRCSRSRAVPAPATRWRSSSGSRQRRGGRLARLELMGYVAGDAVGRYSRTQLSPPLP